jgi:hypothetical protein
LVGTLVVLASIVLALAVVAAYLERALVNGDQFANRATAALRDPTVRSLVAKQITDRVVLERLSGLTTARPLIKSVVSSAVASPAFADLFRSAALGVHRSLFDEKRDTVTLTVPNAGPLVAARLAAVRPSLVPAAEKAQDVALITRDIGATRAGLARRLASIRHLGLLLLALAAVLSAAAILLAHDRRRTITWLGIGAAFAGILVVVALAVLRARAIAGPGTPDGRAAAGAVWDAFFADLTTAGWILAGSGAVVAAAARAGHPPARQRGGRRRRRAAVAAVAAAGVIVAAVAVFLATGGASEAAPAQPPCEGHEQLCNRPLDAVVLAATHNSMSAPLPGWYASQQDRPIADQLRDGIRGLLIDTHYAERLPDGRLRTELGDRTQALADGVSPTAAALARRARERSTARRGSGTRGIYLCHSFCELGGTPLQPVLRELRDFLVANPGAVVVVVNQDYVTPADFVAAVEETGLGSLVYRGPTGPQWPTLRSMIDSGQRVVFLAENHAGAAPWYHLAYEHILQETPFSFRRAAQLTDPAQIPASCRDNRGPEDAPLFLLNNWVTTDPVPLPANAARVNAYAPLLHRIEECRRIRGRLPNLVAVDFYRRGDVFAVVDHLNGVSG